MQIHHHITQHINFYTQCHPYQPLYLVSHISTFIPSVTHINFYNQCQAYQLLYLVSNISTLQNVSIFYYYYLFFIYYLFIYLCKWPRILIKGQKCHSGTQRDMTESHCSFYHYTCPRLPRVIQLIILTRLLLGLWMILPDKFE